MPQEQPSLAASLKIDFLVPPPSARPRVWWHWMNGNVSEDGVRADFQWMQRIGIGGVQNFDAAFDFAAAFEIPQLVSPPVIYLTPEWQRMLRYSVELAQALGFEFAVASSAGWSQSGGPWVEPHQAMKKLVWSETRVSGGGGADPGELLRLPPAPDTTGPFQNLPFTWFAAQGVEIPVRPVHCADVAVVAYRVRSPCEDVKPHVRSSSGTLDSQRLAQARFGEYISLPISAAPCWIEFAYPIAQRMQALTTLIGYPVGSFAPLSAQPVGWLEASEDGKQFRRIAEIPRHDSLPQTIAFPALSARIFRIVLNNNPEPSIAQEIGFVDPPQVHQIAQVILHREARVNRFEDKAGFGTHLIGEDFATPDIAPSDVIPITDVVELTHRLQSDGSLLWWNPAPSECWVVMRFGYSLTGKTNAPASRAGTGLEVDKLSHAHVKSYMDEYLRSFERALGPDLIGARGLTHVLSDSFEAGAQNWTERMPEEFHRRRGYKLTHWLPVLAGRVLNSAEDSDRFLWDFRQTLGELIAEAHYGQMSASLHERGLARYGESHEIYRAFVGDGMQVKKSCDVPMGAFWAARPREFTQAHHDADIRESASVAHIYGQNIVAAEAFTAFGNLYAFTPQSLKPLADRAMANGLNRFVIHTSVHQPDERCGPGVGLGPFGQWFTRKEVWAEMAREWITYLSRSSQLLQQGRYVADIAYLYGEDANITALFGESEPPIPQGYSFDYVNVDALLNEFSVNDGTLRTSSGMQYRVLALDPSVRELSLRLLRQIRTLVSEGALVVGARPTRSASLADDEREFCACVEALWTPPAASLKAAVFTGTIGEALRAIDVAPDVEFLQGHDDLRFVHRTLGDAGDLYFVSNARETARSIVASFRVNGKKPELWRADTGEMTALSYRVERGRTLVSLELQAHDAIFVMFLEPATKQTVSVPRELCEELSEIVGPWEVRFPDGLGAPPAVILKTLRSWSEHDDAGVKYFSGTATYFKKIEIEPEWLEDGARVQLDLGAVRHLAKVWVNARALDVLWKTPFALDITDALSVGENILEIQVANLWPNRLIGDRQPGARPIAFASYNPFTVDSPLIPSGLLGPVTLGRIK